MLSTSLLSLFDDLYESPSLVLGQGTALHHLDGIADAALVVLVVGLQLVGSLDDLLVQRMRHAVFHSDYDGLVHLIGKDLTNPGLAESSCIFTHFALPPQIAVSFSRITVLMRAISFFTRLIFRGLSSWLVACCIRRKNKSFFSSESFFSSSAVVISLNSFAFIVIHHHSQILLLPA